MATTNQKIIAEALHMARIHGFESGLHFLKINGLERFNEESSLSWFANKCKEHAIPSPLFPEEVL